MAYDARKTCPFCAWRAACAKRFSAGNDASLHCPDFSEDLLLRRKGGQEEKAGNDSTVED